MEMQVLNNFTSVSFGMASVQMLGKPDLVLEYSLLSPGTLGCGL